MRPGVRQLIVAALLLAASAAPALGQGVSGRAFEDRDADGIRDAGEPGLSGLAVRLYGTGETVGPVDDLSITGPDGDFAFPAGNGCYLLSPEDPPGWRLSQTRADASPQSTPGYSFPVGLPRLSKLDQALASLEAGQVHIIALGDSIARNFNLCGYPETFWYTKRIRDRLGCVAPQASLTLDAAAVLGEHTDDLLVNDGSGLNNVFRVFEIQPELITLSMIGNDLLGVDPGSSPTPSEINRAVAEILDSRQNLQEALASMISAVPGADIVLNTLYDNEAFNCSTGNPSQFHRTWLPIVNRILRDLAWGQTRRATINEVAADFAHEDQIGACKGFTGMICRDIFHLDDIHPNNNGYTIVREKLWEASGGVTLGPGDILGRPSMQDLDHGYLRRVRRLLPTQWEVINAAVVNPEAALDDDDAGAPAQISLGGAGSEFKLTGFPDWYDEVQIVRAIAGVRYRTTGSAGGNAYRMEASVTGQFRPPPSFNYAPTTWNFFTPIVGGGGPNAPAENPDYAGAAVLAVPNVLAYREASATLSKNPVLPAGAADYEWPPVTHLDLVTTAIRAAGVTAGGPGYEIELDDAWLDLYGWEKPRPSEVMNVTLEWQPDESLMVSFDPLAGAQRYNVYLGRLDSLASGAGIHDHGLAAPSGPLCGATTQDASGGRRRSLIAAPDVPAQDSYILVTAHVDGVESPAGLRSDGSEIDRSESICR